jgi:hypothetical protein
MFVMNTLTALDLLNDVYTAPRPAIWDLVHNI